MNQPATVNLGHESNINASDGILSEYDGIMAWSIHVKPISGEPRVTLRPMDIRMSERVEALTQMGLYLAESLTGDDDAARIQLKHLRCLVFRMPGDGCEALLAVTFSGDSDIGKSIQRIARRVARVWKRPEKPADSGAPTV